MGTGSLCACLIVPRRGTMFAPARKYAMPFADGSEGRIFAGMADILESAPRAHEEPKLVIRKAPHVPVWSVWATLQSPTLYNCCVRFAMVVTSHDATLATRRALPPLPGPDIHRLDLASFLAH